MSSALLVVSYPNGATNTNLLPADQAVGWGDRIAADERASRVLVVFNDLTVSTIK